MIIDIENQCELTLPIQSLIDPSWIESAKELPAEDGEYEISNYCTHSNFSINNACTSDYFISEVIAYYDGYGFKINTCYRNPKYWRSFRHTEKKYGKIKEKENG